MEGHQGAKSFTINEAMGPANSQFSQISAQVQIKRVCPVCNKQFLWNEFDDHLRVHVEPQTYQITDVMNEQVLSHLMQNNFSHIVTITEGGNMQGVVQTLGPQVLTDPSALGHTQILLHTPNEPIQGTSFSDIKEMDNTLCNAAGTQIVLQTVEEAPLKYDNSGEASNTEMLLDAVSKSPVKPYQCAICDQSFKYSTELIRHTHSHGGKVQFQCHGVSFTVVGEPSRPKVDSAKTPEMKTYECHICHRQFPRSLILKAHMKVHSASKRFTCKTCGKQFPSQSYLTRHKRMHYNDSVYPCTSCTETFPTLHLLRAHGRSKHSDNVEDRRRQSDGLSGEMRAVNDARSTQPENSKLQCVACNKEFRVLNNLTRHIKMHYCEAKLPCSICHKRFKSEISLQYHKKVHQAWLRCTKCKKQFRNCSLYKKHKKLHKEEKLYQCDICQKQFSKKQCLEKHAKIHVRKATPTQIRIRDESCINMKEQAKAAADGKPFACPKCEKSFRTVGLLESHVEVHDHGTEAPCLFCSKSFCNTDTLARHMKTKHMDCARKCPVCDRDFPTSDHFNRHMRIHTGEKPYECDVCQRRFSQAANLQTHKRTHTGEKPFKCHVCQKEFTNARNHRTHLVKQH